MALHPALILALALADSPGGQPPIDVGDRLELFVDDHLIQELRAAERVLHRPRSAGIVLRLDRPWEGGLCGYFTVIHDGGKYRMYYRGRPVTTGRDATEAAREVTCYAESADGIEWNRPSLGLFEVSDTMENNVILIEPNAATHNFCPFIDERPGVPASERYKAVGGVARTGLFGFVSADGIRWRLPREEPILRKGAFDSQNVAFWSRSEERYVCYFRTWKDRVRWISRATSEDFVTWSEPVDCGFGEAPAEHLYTNQTGPYFRAPHIYVATPARFHPGRRALTDAQVAAVDLESPANYPGLKNGVSDAVFMTSRGGRRFDRSFLESFIRPGGDLRSWVARANYPVLGVVPTGRREMSLYVQRNYGQPSAHVERLTLRTDGFVSVHAGYGGGELVTRPLRFGATSDAPDRNTARTLVVNYATSAAGGIRVEIQDTDGRPIPGFALADSTELIGDEIERVVSWKNGDDVRSLADRPVRLRFQLRDADLWSIRFR